VREDGAEKTYRIVGVDEADPQQGTISWLSPVARGLLSRRAGDEVALHIPGGTRKLTILRVEY
jgi:transcription elongation factor GreB